MQGQLQDPVVRARLLELPETLAREARGARRRSPAKRLHQMRTAIAFELVLETGMRSPELADLRVEQVQPPADGVTNGCILAVATDGMGSRCDYQLSAPCAARVLDYIEHFRPSTTSSRPRALLFVQRHERPVTSTALADAIKKATKRHLGAALAPSHLRHFVATLYLQSSPGDLSGLKDLLGHRHLQTTALLYGHLGDDWGSRELGGAPGPGLPVGQHRGWTSWLRLAYMASSTGPRKTVGYGRSQPRPRLTSSNVGNALGGVRKPCARRCGHMAVGSATCPSVIPSRCARPRSNDSAASDSNGSSGAYAANVKPQSVASFIGHYINALHAVAPSYNTAFLRVVGSYQRQATLRARFAKRIEALDLYSLGIDLMNRAAGMRAPHERATTYRDGLLIALLISSPLRRRNLSQLRLQKHLRRVGDQYWIVVDGEETKSGQAIEHALPPR